MEPKDYEDIFTALSQRINGGSKYDSLLDRLKKEFMDYKLLTIENVESIAGTEIHYKGNKFYVDSVERTSTSYNFILRKHYFIGADVDTKMVLSRVPKDGMYYLYNDTNGASHKMNIGLLKHKNEFLKILVGLTDELPF